MLGFLLLVLAYGPDSQLDINRAGRAEIRELPVDAPLAEGIQEFIALHGRLSSIYELMEVQGMTSAKLEELKPLIYISPPAEDPRRTRNVYRIQQRLASEDGPTATAVEEWQDRLLDPMNINRARVDDLYLLDNVSLVDAVSVVRHLESGQEIRSRYDLSNRVPGLSSYGYRNIRDYVEYTDVELNSIGGNYRLNYDLDPEWDTEAAEGEFAVALTELDGLLPEQFLAAGFDTTEIDTFRAFVRNRLEQEQEFLRTMDSRAGVSNRVRLRFGKYARGGAWFERKLYRGIEVRDVKGFAGIQDLLFVRRLLLGDYRVTLGQGLLLDNTAELIRRTHERPQGVFNDLGENAGFGFRGGAAELVAGPVGFVGFFSKTRRDAIPNPDGTVNYYIITTPQYSTFSGVLGETDYGGSIRFDLGKLPLVPVGTRLALNGLGIGYDRRFKPEVRYLDLAGDGTELLDPNYLRLSRGRDRLFYGGDFRTVVENVSVEGEFAFDDDKPDDRTRLPLACLVKTRAQYDYLYLTGLYRHYDVDYDNPYNRGYGEQLRFEDTEIEKPYRVVDPAYSALQDFPMPKAEEGFLLETRYQVSRQVTFTSVYVDAWRNLALGVNNVRFQGEVEWRPVYPLRLRFKQKLQSKGLPKPVLSTRSFTMESSLRLMASLTDYDFLSAEVREGRVLLTPNPSYGDDASMSGNFVAVQWEHNFGEDFSTEVGVSMWATRDMSQWIFEDTGIDFLEDEGLKWYVALSDRISDRLLLYLKTRQKITRSPRNGYGSEEGVHYRGTSEAVREFISTSDAFNVSLQLDVFW